MPKPKKLGRKKFPDGLKSTDLTYMGRGSIDRDDFESDVGIADMVCVDQFGEVNQSKYYHVGVVKSNDSQWFVYLEWGRVFAGKSWISESHYGQDFQFVPCKDEDEARDFFQWQCRDKNTKRLEEKKIAGVKLWVGKGGKSGYIVQALSTREKGLPNACSIKDDSGVKTDKKKKVTKKKRSTTKTTHQPQVVTLAKSLVGGVQAYVQAAISATGVSPTMAAIDKVRNDLIPLAGKRIAKVGNDIDKQLKDKQLIDISTLVATIIPRPISRGGSSRARQEAIILSSDKIAEVRQDLDTFEAALNNEDFEQVESNDGTDPSDALLGQGCEILWIDPKSEKGNWLESSYRSMTNDRHSYITGQLKILNMFEINRPDRDKKFIDYAKKIADKNQRTRYDLHARLQPGSRNDVSDISDLVRDANIFLGIHGTRSVNVQPILSSNLRLPKHLPNTQITGAAFGSGLYFASDRSKSYGYTGHGRAYYGGGGGVSGRGFFMFLCDVVMGDSYKAKDTGSWASPPNQKDSIAAYPDFMSYLENDEHIVFDENAHRIRYLIEGDFV